MEPKFLPKGWRELTLGQVAKYVNGRAFKPSEWKKTGLPIIRIQNLNDSKRVFNYFDGEYEPRYHVDNDDILISWSASLGVYVWERGPAILNQHIFKVLPNESLVERRYLVYAVETILEEMKSRVHGSTMKHIVKGDFQSLKIPVPPLSLQRKIADVLDAGRRLQKLRERSNILSSKVIQSLFVKTFGDPVTNLLGWEVRKLKEVCTKITDGSHGSPPNSKDWSKTGVPYITAKNVRPWGIDLSDLTYVKKDAHEAIYNRCNPEKYDVLYVKDGVKTGIAAVNILDFEFTMLSSLALFKPDKSIMNPFYLESALNNPSMHARNVSIMKGAAIRRLTLDQLSVVEIPIPPIDMQNKFGVFAERFSTLRQKQKEAAGEVDELFLTVMHKAFRGGLVA